MRKKQIKKILSFLLAMVLVCSLMPFSASASETVPEQSVPESVPQSTETETPTEPTEAEAAEETTQPADALISAQIQQRIDAILAQYGITQEMTDREIANAIIAADGKSLQATIEEMTALEEDGAVLTDEQLQSMGQESLALYGRFCAVLEAMNAPATVATSVNVSNGKISVSDTKGNVSSITGGAQITVSATAGALAFGGKTETNTITVKNISGSKAQISFTYSATNQDKCTFTSTGTTDGNLHVVTLEANGTLTISLSVKAGRNSAKTATLKLTGFSCVELSDKQVTVSVSSNNSTLGSATANSGASATVAAGGTVALSATANGSTFLGWVNTADNSVVTTSANYNYVVAENISLQALFINSSSPVWFGVGDIAATTTQDAYESLDTDGKLGGEYDMAYTYYTIAPMYLYDNLTDALGKAKNSSCKGVVPMYSGTISGDFIIPDGVTLLIPFDSANTMYTTVPGFIYSDNKGVEDLYCSLTLASDSSITVNSGGAISVSTVAHSADGAETGGYPCGDYSKLVLQADSTITVNGGANLYVWGFITGDSTGSGTITVKSGATVYESFQMAGHRGGNQSTSMKNGVFPISQYYVHNVEVPMTLEAGAVETCNTWINVSSLMYKDTQVPIAFVGSNGLFNLTYGKVTKYYDGTKDRWGLIIEGDVTISPMTLSFGDDGSINSASYILGINNNLTLEIKSGTVTVGQNIAFQPGSELVIENGAKCVLGEGVSAYVYDGDNWGNFCFNGSDVQFIPVKFAPSKSYTRTAADLVDVIARIDGELDASKGYLYTTQGTNSPEYANIYSTGTGIVKMQPGTKTTTHQLMQSGGSYSTIPIKPAQLKNADDTYTDTSGGAAEYFYAHGLWHKKGDPVCVTCAEASIGTGDSATYYWTLAEAVSAASPGADISLLKNVETAVTVDKPLIILRSANKYTVNLSTADGLFLCTSDAAYAVTKGFTLRSAECSYEAEVVLRMKLYIPDVFLDGDYTIRLIKDGRFGKVETLYTMAELKAAGADKNGLYWAMAGVASGEMTCNVAIDIQDGSGNPVTIYQPNGNEVGDSFTYTVKQYVDGVLASGLSENHKAAANALAVYGGYAQQYFNVSPDKLAYEGLEMPDLNTVTADAVGHAVTYTGSEAGITVKSIEPFLDSATYLRLKFLITDGSDISNFTFTTTDAKGNSQTLKAFYEEESKRYCVDIPDIHAVYLDHTYTVTVTNNTTSKAHTVNASVLSWVNLAISKSTDTKQVNMAKALYLYNQAADTLFGE